MNKTKLSDPLALCNDGSSAAYFYANCTANWDAKVGSPDYCAKNLSVGSQGTNTCFLSCLLQVLACDVLFHGRSV